MKNSLSNTYLGILVLDLTSFRFLDTWIFEKCQRIWLLNDSLNYNKIVIFYNSNSFSQLALYTSIHQQICANVQISALWLLWSLLKNDIRIMNNNICNCVGLLHHPFWLELVLALFGHYFSNF